MPKTVEIDFSQIKDWDGFYRHLHRAFPLPAHFGDNLDALYDYISAELELPIHIRFVHINRQQQKFFRKLWHLLEMAERNVSGFSFSKTI